MNRLSGAALSIQPRLEKSKYGFVSGPSAHTRLPLSISLSFGSSYAGNYHHCHRRHTHHYNHRNHVISGFCRLGATSELCVCVCVSVCVVSLHTPLAE